METVDVEINHLISVGARHEPAIRDYAVPQLEEKLEHIASVREGMRTESVNATLQSRVELVERENGLVAVWARRELAVPVLYDLLMQKRELVRNKNLAHVGLTELRRELNVRSKVLEMVAA